MTLTEFRDEYKRLEAKVSEAEKALRDAQAELNSFLDERLGVGNGQVATLLSVVNIVEKVLEMRK